MVEALVVMGVFILGIVITGCVTIAHIISMQAKKE